MRYLPFVLLSKSELTEAIRSAAEDPNRCILCSTCGGRILIRQEQREEIVRCPHCWRWQRANPGSPAKPWRLSASAAIALRRTRAWARHL